MFTDSKTDPKIWNRHNCRIHRRRSPTEGHGYPTRLWELPANDTCYRCIFKGLLSTVQVRVSRVMQLTSSSSSLVLTSCTVTSAINISTVVQQSCCEADVRDPNGDHPDYIYASAHRKQLLQNVCVRDKDATTLLSRHG